MDAGNVVVGRLDRIRWAMRRTGFYSPGSKGSLTDWTHSATFLYFGLRPDWGLDKSNLNGACIAFDTSREAGRLLAAEWARLALIREAIAPEGSDRTNHRQDQALLSVLAHRAGLVQGMPSRYLGFKIHRDID